MARTSENPEAQEAPEDDLALVHSLQGSEGVPVQSSHESQQLIDLQLAQEGSRPLSDKDLFFVLIPCHNDCLKAAKMREHLRSTTDAEIFVGHNGCKGRACLPWSNKARTINFFGRVRHERYIVNLDADVKIEGDILFAFRERMRLGVRYGCAMVVHKLSEQNVEYVDETGVFTGQAWFCNRELLNEVQVPEDIITEDTAFICLLKKRKVKPITVHGAVITAWVDEPTFGKQFRQAVRYSLGGFQMFARRLWYAEAIHDYSLMSVHMLVVFACIVSGWSFFFAMIGVYALFALSGLRFYKVGRKRKFSRSGIISFLDMTIVPFIAYYAFIRRRWIW